MDVTGLCVVEAGSTTCQKFPAIEFLYYASWFLWYFRLQYLDSSSYMDRFSWIAVGVFFFGLVILLIPDDASPVFKLNKTHGPSLPDLGGLILMFGSWFLCLSKIVGRWKPIVKRLGKNNAYLGMGLYFLFLSGIVAALVFSIEWMLWFSIAFASMINIGFIIFAWQAKNPKAD